MDTKNPHYMAEYMRNRRLNDEDFHKKTNENTARASVRFRLKLLDMLGGRICVKCDFNNVLALQIDHKQGNGKHDLKRFKSAYAIYRYYLDHPKLAKQNLQVLCANCNIIKKIENKEHLKYYN